MRVPGATYRIQCHAEFPLAAVRAIVPYLDDLGISDVYLSPITQARAGSTHGYDVVDPRRLDPRIGDERELRELGADLRNRGMGLLLDIVPNHMATSPENPWWLDVLENGAGSPYAGWFDIQWQPTAVKGGLRGKLLLPILGAPYGEVLENKELQLALEEDLPVLRYYEHRLPLSTRSFPHLLRPALAGLRENHGAEHPAARALARLADESDQVPPRIEEPAGDGRADAQVKRHLSTLLREHPEARVQLERAIEQLNGIAGDPASFNALDRLLSEQPYWLAYWRLASQEINYRRFFNITDLVAVRVEERAVFDAVHEFVLWLAREGIVGGFRVDHIDGLWSPAAYLKQLQRRLAGNRRERAYVVVEKILARGEELPQGWECAGTTGYEFILALNDLLVDSAGLAELGGAYARLADGEPGFEEVRYEKKKLVMQRLFGGEVASLAERLGSLASLDRHARDLPLAELGRALVETTACLAVYRTYIEGPEVAPADRAVLERALAEARRRLTAEDVSDAAFSFLRRVLLMEPVYGLPGVRRARLQFVMRWQQFTGAAMAKGLEDTTFYVYNRLVSLNEVGGEPDSAPGGVAAFHQFCARRLERHPGALNATSTHDTKRSEDVRARIHLLAEIPAEWEAAVLRWSELNAPRRRVVRGQRVPGPNHEYLLYQNLVGAWPLDERERPALRERFRDYMLKAAREAQVRTSWIRPDEDHEQALSGFVDEILDPALSAAFLADFAGFHARIAYAGALNSLAQVALKVAAPGVPDVYQGTEMWDFSLVDPDNRRPVDYDARRQALASVDEPGAARSLAEALHRGWRDGRLKLYVLARALRHRREHAELFARGTYAPLPASGPHARHVCAFARRLGEDWLLCAVPRLPLRLGLGSVPAPWAEDALALPDGAPAAWRDLFTGASVRARNDVLPLAEVFATLPLALLVPDAGAD